MGAAAGEQLEKKDKGKAPAVEYSYGHRSRQQAASHPAKRRKRRRGRFPGQTREEVDASVERLAQLLDLENPRIQPAGKEGFMTLAVTQEMFAIDEAYSPLSSQSSKSVSSNPVWSLLAARYLPEAVQAFLRCPTPWSDYAAAIHACERSIYWSKFCELDQGCAELAREQAIRMATWPFNVNKASDGTWFLSACSFLSVLLCWSPLAPSVVVPPLTSRQLTTRIRSLLNQPGFGSSSHSVFSHLHDRQMLERLLAYLPLPEPLGRDALGFGKESKMCARRDCPRELGDGFGSELKRCARCRCVLFCGTECQRREWKRHRKHCFVSSLTTGLEELEEMYVRALEEEEAKERRRRSASCYYYYGCSGEEDQDEERRDGLGEAGSQGAGWYDADGTCECDCQLCDGSDATSATPGTAPGTTAGTGMGAAGRGRGMSTTAATTTAAGYWSSVGAARLGGAKRGGCLVHGPLCDGSGADCRRASVRERDAGAGAGMGKDREREQEDDEISID